MIAANNDGNGRDKKPAPTTPTSVTHGGEWGGYFNARHYRRQARQIRSLVKAGALAADDMKAIVADAKELAAVCKEHGDVRGWVALSGLVFEIAKCGVQQAEQHQHLHLHQGDQNMQVVFVDDWYGSKAANTTAANGTPAKGAIEP